MHSVLCHWKNIPFVKISSIYFVYLNSYHETISSGGSTVTSWFTTATSPQSICLLIPLQATIYQTHLKHKC